MALFPGYWSRLPGNNNRQACIKATSQFSSSLSWRRQALCVCFFNGIREAKLNWFWKVQAIPGKMWTWSVVHVPTLSTGTLFVPPKTTTASSSPDTIPGSRFQMCCTFAPGQGEQHAEIPTTFVHHKSALAPNHGCTNDFYFTSFICSVFSFASFLCQSFICLGTFLIVTFRFVVNHRCTHWRGGQTCYWSQHLGRFSLCRYHCI